MTPCLDFLLDLARDLDVSIAMGHLPRGHGEWLRIELPTRTVEWSGWTIEAAAQRVIEFEFPYLADLLSPPLEA
jgi:hypothetical protein